MKYNNKILKSITLQQVYSLKPTTSLFVKLAPTDNQLSHFIVTHDYLISACTQSRIYFDQLLDTYEYYIEDISKQQLLDKLLDCMTMTDLSLCECIQNIRDTYYFQTGEYLDMNINNDDYFETCLDDCVKNYKLDKEM